MALLAVITKYLNCVSALNSTAQENPVAELYFFASLPPRTSLLAVNARLSDTLSMVDAFAPVAVIVSKGLNMDCISVGKVL
jgi:hypothetical protein